jgi:hypothetical protein
MSILSDETTMPSVPARMIEEKGFVLTLCGPKFLRGIEEPCDGSCCGLGKEGKPDPIMTEKLNRRVDAWRRILGTDKSSHPDAPREASRVARRPIDGSCARPLLHLPQCCYRDVRPA